MAFVIENDSVDAYKDYTYIMYVLCDKTASFYSKIKNIINIPIVVCSTGLSILNTINFSDNVDKMLIISYISTAFNLLIALSIAVLNIYKIPEKEFSFKSHSMNFLKLHNKINAEITKSKTVMINIDIVSIINEFNLLCEYITFHIPSHIRKDIQKNYPSYKFPLLLTNNTKEPDVRKTTLSKYLKKMMKIQESSNQLHVQQYKHKSELTESDISDVVSIEDCVAIELNSVNSSTSSNNENKKNKTTLPSIYSHSYPPSCNQSPFSVLAENMQYSPLFAIQGKRSRPLRPFKNHKPQ